MVYPHDIDSTARFSTEHLLVAVGYSHAPWHVRHVTLRSFTAQPRPLNWDCNPRRNGPHRPEGKRRNALIWCLKMEYTYLTYPPNLHFEIEKQIDPWESGVAYFQRNPLEKHTRFAEAFLWRT